MPDSINETAPLLPINNRSQEHLFDKLDQDCDWNQVHDHPPCPKRRKVRNHLTNATLPPAHGSPCHHHLQSPALILRIQQALEHGFGAILRASKTIFKHKIGKTPHPTGAPSMHTIVSTVFFLAVLTMLAMTSIGPTLLLYMNHVGFTTSTNISPYVLASSFSSAVPIVTNIVLGFVASRLGPGRALAIGALFSAVGMLLILFGRQSLLLFFVGYGMYASSNSLRVIRLSILTKVVPEKERTTVLATHALMTPVGALMGPMIWIGFQTYRGSFPFLGGLLSLDRFFLVYGFVFVVLLTIALISALMLNRIVDVTATGSAEGTAASSGTDLNLDRHGDHEVTLHYTDGHEQTVNLDHHKARVFRYFCGIMFGVNLSAGFFMTSFQPVIVNVFHVTDAKLGFIFELIAMFAILPPLMVAVLSRYLMDRQIILIGLLAKIIGMLLFLPLFGPVREWQVIVGFMLIIKASIFFSTASMSLFTKVLGAMSTSSLIGLLASGSNVGPAIAQIAFADHIVTKFGSFSFGIFAIPAIVSLGFVLYPTYWRRLDPGTEFYQLLISETREMRSGGSGR